MLTIDKSFAAELLPRREDTAAKWSFGKLLSLCGSQNMPGAATLSSYAALRSGVGLVTLASVESVVSAAAVNVPECTFITMPCHEGHPRENKTISGDGFSAIKRALTGSTAVLCGCGLGISDGTRALIKTLLTHCDVPLVLDADALNIIGESPEILETRKCRDVILTPHIGELSRLSGGGEITDAPAAALTLAKKYGVCVIAKGSATYITDGGEGYIHALPNSGMAKGGSGDILAGIIASLCAQGLAAVKAAVLAVYIHGRAGELARMKRGAYSMLPRDTADCISKAFMELSQ